MRHFPLTARSAPHQPASIRPLPRAIAATDDRARLQRGGFYATTLSLAVWITAGCLAFILR